jgi:hypothetical protein
MSRISRPIWSADLPRSTRLRVLRFESGPELSALLTQTKEARARRRNAPFAGVFMTTISAAAPLSIADTLAQLITGGSSGPLTPAATNTNSAASSTAPSTVGAGPATVVTLSDPAKAAAKAQSDQVAADRLQAYVDRVQDYTAAHKTTATSLQNILDTNTQPVGPRLRTHSRQPAARRSQRSWRRSIRSPTPMNRRRSNHSYRARACRTA